MTQQPLSVQYKPARDVRGRFLPGNSGNPKGRPRNNDDLVGADASAYVFAKTIRKLNMNGKTVEMTTAEALNHKAFQLAMTGDTRALIWLSKRIDEEYEEIVEAPKTMLRLLDRWRAEPDDRKKDRIMETIWSMREMLDSLNLTVAMKNDKKQRR